VFANESLDAGVERELIRPPSGAVKNRGQPLIVRELNLIDAIGRCPRFLIENGAAGSEFVEHVNPRSNGN
jgi:hypothetical protein